mgnify:CR=1 FL=1
MVIYKANVVPNPRHAGWNPHTVGTTRVSLKLRFTSEALCRPDCCRCESRCNEATSLTHQLTVPTSAIPCPIESRFAVASPKEASQLNDGCTAGICRSLNKKRRALLLTENQLQRRRLLFKSYLFNSSTACTSISMAAGMASSSRSNSALCSGWVVSVPMPT